MLPVTLPCFVAAAASVCFRARGVTLRGRCFRAEKPEGFVYAKLGNTRTEWKLKQAEMEIGEI